MRRASRIPIVLMAAMLPLVVWGQDDNADRPLWSGAKRTARLGNESESTVKVLHPGDDRAALSARVEVAVWRASSSEVTVQRSSRRLSGLAKLFGRSERPVASSPDPVVVPASDARLQRKGRLP